MALLQQQALRKGTNRAGPPHGAPAERVQGFWRSAHAPEEAEEQKPMLNRRGHSLTEECWLVPATRCCSLPITAFVWTACSPLMCFVISRCFCWLMPSCFCLLMSSLQPPLKPEPYPLTSPCAQTDCPPAPPLHLTNPQCLMPCQACCCLPHQPLLQPQSTATVCIHTASSVTFPPCPSQPC